ncbi:MAG: aldo/keto reductase, partial [Bacteroidales bacterium]|nr:aldo/keto reductase [Bacteroidales bacterium]
MNEEMKSVDPRLVPVVRLATGDKIPVIGMGTFGSDNYSAVEIAEAVRTAVKMG